MVGQEKICSGISYCNPSCSNYTILQGLSCTCYEGKVHVISIWWLQFILSTECSPPCMNEEDASTIIPASVLHTGLENTVNKVCHLLPILSHIQTVLCPWVFLPVIWPVWMEEHVVVMVTVHVWLDMMGYNMKINKVLLINSSTVIIANFLIRTSNAMLIKTYHLQFLTIINHIQ